MFGGSLGARRINDATLGLASRWRDRADVVIRHVASRRDYQRCVQEWEQSRSDADRIAYEIVEYEDDMASFYGWSDVVVTRAGAVTVAELAVLALPAVVVPLPGAPSDHQSANAAALVKAGAAVAVPDTECTPDRLARELDALLGAPDRLTAMQGAALALARPDAAARGRGSRRGGHAVTGSAPNPATTNLDLSRPRRPHRGHRSRGHRARSRSCSRGWGTR